MSNALKTFFMILCTLICLVCLVFAVLGIVSVGGSNGIILTLTCAMIAAPFGYSTYQLWNEIKPKSTK